MMTCASLTDRFKNVAIGDAPLGAVAERSVPGVHAVLACYNTRQVKDIVGYIQALAAVIGDSPVAIRGVQVGQRLRVRA